MTTLFHSKIETKKVLRKQEILSQLEKLVPWSMLVAKIDEYRDQKNLWRKYIPTIIIVKMMVLQFVYWLSDEWIEEDMYDRSTFRWFIWEDLLIKHGVPDSTTLCRFRRLLEKHQLHTIIFDSILLKLEEDWVYMKRWTAVDATIIQAPSSTKNKSKKRDPEMRSTKKGANYYFWMKQHHGVDIETWIVHSVVFTPANVHDSTQIIDLLHGEEKIISWDKAYASKDLKRLCRENGTVYAVIEKAPRRKKWEKKKELSTSQQKRNRKNQSLKAKVELPFWVLKKRRQNKKTRFKWLYKNEVWLTIAISIWNMFLWDRYKRKRKMGEYAVT